MYSGFNKKIICCVAPLLTFHINFRLTESVFPKELILSRTVPIYREGSKSDISSYNRPISLIPV